MQLTTLRHRAVCRSCQSKLLPRTEAWLDDDGRGAVCVSCVRFGEAEPLAVAAPADVVPSGPSAATTATDGGPTPRRVPKRTPVRAADEAPAPAESTAWTAAAARVAAAAKAREVVVDGTPLKVDGVPPRIGGPPAEPARGGAVPAPAHAPAPAGRPNLRLVSSNPTPEDSGRRHGGLLLAVDDRATDLVDRGDAGEGRVGQTLEGARVHGLEVLHHRRVPSSVVGIDHLVIAVNGIWVVDASQRLDGKLERRDTGDWFTSHPRLFIGGADRTNLIDGVQAQVAAVKSVLHDSPYADAPVYGVLCFEAALDGWVREPFTLNGVAVTWRRHLVEPMLAPFQFDPAARADLTRFLAAHAPAA